MNDHLKKKMEFVSDPKDLQKSTVFSSIDDLKKRIRELMFVQDLPLWFHPKKWSFEGLTLYLDTEAPESLKTIPEDPSVLFQLLFGLYVANTSLGINPKDGSKFIVVQKKQHTMSFGLESKGYVDVFQFETSYHVTLDYQDFGVGEDVNLETVAKVFKSLLDKSSNGKLLLGQLLNPNQDYGSGIRWGLNLALFHPLFADYYKGEVPYKEIDDREEDVLIFDNGHRRMWSEIEKDHYRNKLAQTSKAITKEIEQVFQKERSSKYPIEKFAKVVTALLVLWERSKQSDFSFDESIKALKAVYTSFRKIYSEDFVDGLGFLYRFTLEKNNALLKEGDFDPRPRSVLGAQIPERTRGYIGVFLSIIGLISGKFYQDMSEVATAMETSDFVFNDASYPSIETIHNDFLANFEEAKTSFDDAQKKKEQKRKEKQKEAERKAKEKEQEETREVRRKEKEAEREAKEKEQKEEAEKRAREKEREIRRKEKEAEREAKEKEQKEEKERVAREKEQQEKKEEEEAERKAREKERKERIKVDSDTEEEEEEKVLPDKPPPKREAFPQNIEEVKDNPVLDEVVDIFKRIRNQFLLQNYSGGVDDSVVETYAIEFHKFAEIVNANNDLKAKLRDMYNPDAPNPLPAWVSIKGASYYPKETFVSSTKIIQAPGAVLSEKVREGGYKVKMIENDKKWASNSLHERVTEHLFLIHGTILILAGFKKKSPDEYRNLSNNLRGEQGGYKQPKGLKTVFLNYFNNVFELPAPYNTEVTRKPLAKTTGVERNDKIDIANNLKRHLKTLMEHLNDDQDYILGKAVPRSSIVKKYGETLHDIAVQIYNIKPQGIITQWINPKNKSFIEGKIPKEGVKIIKPKTIELTFGKYSKDEITDYLVQEKATYSIQSDGGGYIQNFVVFAGDMMTHMITMSGIVYILLNEKATKEEAKEKVQIPLIDNLVEWQKNPKDKQKIEVFFDIADEFLNK